MMSVQRPFLDYYASLGTSPVSQDVSDLARHLERRSALYRALGLPPRFFSLADVLEFGPGLGHNAIHVAEQSPRRHVLVDGSATGLAGLRRTLERHFGSTERFEIVESLAEEYRAERRFDVVLAENMIPLQREPIAFCRQIASHVREGGVLVVTCSEPVSYMGEALRRMVATRIAPVGLPLDERVALVRELFAEHMAQLPGASRPAEDWIKDNVTHPLIGKFFTIADAIESVGAEFDFYGSSPQFVTDWRWYKSLYGENRRFNERACDQYRANVLNLMDWRIVVPPQPPELGAWLQDRCERLWLSLRANEDAGRAPDDAAFAVACEEIAARIEGLAPPTGASLRELAAYLRAPKGADPREYLVQFAGFFGRTQYVSFVRRAQAAPEVRP